MTFKAAAEHFTELPSLDLTVPWPLQHGRDGDLQDCQRFTDHRPRLQLSAGGHQRIPERGALGTIVIRLGACPMRINPQAPGQLAGGISNTEQIIGQSVQCLLINTPRPDDVLMHGHRAVPGQPPEMGLEQPGVRLRMAG